MSESFVPQYVLLMATPTSEVAAHWENALTGSCDVHRATDFLETEREVIRCKPSVVLFDVCLLPCKRFEGFSSLLRLSPASKIILFSENPDESQAVQAIRSGARGYSHRDIDAVLLRKAVEVVRKGEFWLSRRIIARMLDDLVDVRSIDPSMKNREAEGPTGASNRALQFQRLTARQQEVVRLIGSGASNKEIAHLLKISEATAKAHLSRIFQKLGFLDRVSLAVWMTQRAWTESPEKQSMGLQNF